jgi:hypothetical protein
MAIPFKTFANMDNQFKGWPYHEQLFQAHKNPQMEYSDLLSKALEYLEGINETEETASSNVILDRVRLLLPLGYHESFLNQRNWDPAYVKFRQSPLFKDRMKQRGALKHWQQAGFPKQCRPVGEDDFVCD